MCRQTPPETLFPNSVTSINEILATLSFRFRYGECILEFIVYLLKVGSEFSTNEWNWNYSKEEIIRFLSKFYIWFLSKVMFGIWNYLNFNCWVKLTQPIVIFNLKISSRTVVHAFWTLILKMKCFIRWEHINKWRWLSS